MAGLDRFHCTSINRICVRVVVCLHTTVHVYIINPRRGRVTVVCFVTVSFIHCVT